MKRVRGRAKGGGLPWEIIFTVLGVAALVAACLIQPYMESKMYNKLTGAHTTMWDAMWVELRVQESPR